MFKKSTDKPTAISTLFAMSLVAGLGACGGSGQDKGTAESQMRIFQGVAVDGYLARSMVFLDFDNNGTRDPWEPYAFTDDDGYFSYNPLTGTHYCTDDGDEANLLHCLRSKRAFDQAVLRVDGGYDVMTGEPFAGQLSRRLGQSTTASTELSVVSPLTTVFTDIRDVDKKANLLLALGIDENDLNVDYFNADGLGTIEPELFNTALKLHKVATILADRLQDTYSDIGNEVGTPNDVSALVYRNLARHLAADGADFGLVMTSDTSLRQVLQEAEHETQEIYQLRGLDLPRINPWSTGTVELVQVVQHALRIAPLVDAMVPRSAAPTTDLKGQVRAVEAVVMKILQEDTAADPTIAGAASFLTNPANRDLANALAQALSSDRADLASLARRNFNDLHTEDQVMTAARLPDSVQPFRNLVGMQLKVSDLDLGFAPDQLKDIEVEAYFQGNRNATKGQLHACIKYIEDAHSDGTLGEANTRGELVHGHWSLLNAQGNDGGSYSLLLTIQFLGTQYQAIMKPNGMEHVDGQEYHRVRFDYADQIRNWYSLEGLKSSDSLPLSKHDCETRLPPRIHGL